MASGELPGLDFVVTVGKRRVTEDCGAVARNLVAGVFPSIEFFMGERVIEAEAEGLMTSSDID
jgi:hypothetical protein